MRGMPLDIRYPKVKFRESCSLSPLAPTFNHVQLEFVLILRLPYTPSELPYIDFFFPYLISYYLVLSTLPVQQGHLKTLVIVDGVRVDLYV